MVYYDLFKISRYILIAFFFSISICIETKTRSQFDFFSYPINNLEHKYGFFSEEHRVQMLEKTRTMFYFAYESYMKYAFPMDELNPINCEGRGPDVKNPSNININDVLGNYSLTLVDALDTLLIVGNVTEFQAAVQLVINNVSFENNSTIQVFEANIRVIGGLLSAHLLLKDPLQPFGKMDVSWYQNELLEMAHDLATRLLPAFDNTSTGIPFPRVNLLSGVPPDCLTHTCLAGAGSLLVEFGLLSRLIGDHTFEFYARRAINSLWTRKSKYTGLFGNVIDVQTGEWIGAMSGVGAGQDSFYEYLLKSYILFGEAEDWAKFNESYSNIKRFMRRGRKHCNLGSGNHPMYVNVNMDDGKTSTAWVDSLQAAFAGVQVLIGDIEEAICGHALYYSIWKLYGALPERFNWQRLKPEVLFYPLRPELMESTYLLYQVTGHPFYLHVGRDILTSLENHTRAECGYATLHNVIDKSQEDRMESFFLSETCKYLYLLFDKDNPLNRRPDQYLFTTEGHVIPLRMVPKAAWWKWDKKPTSIGRANNDTVRCKAVDKDRFYSLPLRSEYLAQIHNTLGLVDM